MDSIAKLAIVKHFD